MVVNVKIEQIDVCENGIYLVKDGKIERLEGPPNGYGKQTVNWQNGKPSHIDFYYSKKI